MDFQVEQDQWANWGQLAILAHWDMDLLDFKGLKEIMGYLACQDSLDLQVRKQ